MAAPIWLASIAVTLIGVALLITVRLSLAMGNGTELAVFGAMLIALGVDLGAVGGGVRNPYVLIIIFGGLSAILIGAYAFSWFGAQGIF
ncbi:MAG: hypothetical protein WCB19_05695 [Thermoplasmata archaeon]